MSLTTTRTVQTSLTQQVLTFNNFEKLSIQVHTTFIGFVNNSEAEIISKCSALFSRSSASQERKPVFSLIENKSLPLPPRNLFKNWNSLRNVYLLFCMKFLYMSFDFPAQQFEKSLKLKHFQAKLYSHKKLEKFLVLYYGNLF